MPLIETLREFSGIPKWTQGTAERDGKLWKITWSIISRINRKPIVDWFDDGEYKEYLREIRP